MTQPAPLCPAPITVFSIFCARGDEEPEEFLPYIFVLHQSEVCGYITCWWWKAVCLIMICLLNHKFKKNHNMILKFKAPCWSGIQDLSSHTTQMTLYTQLVFPPPPHSSWWHTFTLIKRVFSLSAAGVVRRTATLKWCYIYLWQWTKHLYKVPAITESQSPQQFPVSSTSRSLTISLRS
jgi:hypothetical protein